MFSVTIEELILAYVAVVFILPGALLLLQLWGPSNTADWQVSETRLARCRDCNFPFLIARQRTVSRCPRCQSVRVSHQK